MSKSTHGVPVGGDDPSAEFNFPPPTAGAAPVNFAAPTVGVHSVHSVPSVAEGIASAPPPTAAGQPSTLASAPPPAAAAFVEPSLADFQWDVAPASPVFDIPEGDLQSVDLGSFSDTVLVTEPTASTGPVPTYDILDVRSAPEFGSAYEQAFGVVSTPVAPAEPVVSSVSSAPAVASAPVVSSAPPVASAPEVSSAPAPTAAASLGEDDLLNFPPPRVNNQPRHADEPVAPATATMPLTVVDFGEEAGYENADPDLTTALRDVLLMNASDLHISANMPPMVRVDGGLRASSFTEAWDAERVHNALRTIMTPAQQEIFDRDLELDFAYTVSSNARFRVNIYQQREAMGAAFRLIPTEIKQLADLGVPDSVARFATLARGLVLVTGPTGSGKSTTLAALVDLVNRTRADHIMTVEDPIEFLHGNHKSLVNQREVGNDTHSFGAALKHVLRQDPDVILIGELRDLETISVALTAAETGHLVFATLHTQDAAQTIDRIIDVFPPHQQGQVRSQLAATLQGVVCQTLVKKASGKGRVVATEVLVATPAIANLIREGKTYQVSSAMQAGGDLGMHTMDRHLADLVNGGVITQKAAVDKAQDLEGLKQMIHRVETPSDTTNLSMAAASIDYGDSFSGVKS